MAKVVLTASPHGERGGRRGGIQHPGRGRGKGRAKEEGEGGGSGHEEHGKRGGQRGNGRTALWGDHRVATSPRPGLVNSRLPQGGTCGGEGSTREDEGDAQLC